MSDGMQVSYRFPDKLPEQQSQHYSRRPSHEECAAPAHPGSDLSGKNGREGQPYQRGGTDDHADVAASALWGGRLLDRSCDGRPSRTLGEPHEYAHREQLSEGSDYSRKPGQKGKRKNSGHQNRATADAVGNST